MEFLFSVVILFFIIFMLAFVLLAGFILFFIFSKLNLSTLLKSNFAPAIKYFLKRKNVITNGIPATAKVLSVNYKGMTINKQPMLDLKLEVTIPNKNSRIIDDSFLVPQPLLSFVQPGYVVPVKVDPQNLNIVELNLWTQAAQGFSATQGINNLQACENTGLVGNLDAGDIVDGKPGLAKILDVKEIGKQKNDQKIYLISCEISGEGIEKYVINKEAPLPSYSLQFFKAGMIYPCSIDKKTPNRVKIFTS